MTDEITRLHSELDSFREAGKAVSQLQRIPHSLDDFFAGRQDTGKCHCATINDCFTVHQNLEFLVMASNHFYVGTQLATNTRRHTDGVKSRHSVGAEMNS